MQPQKLTGYNTQPHQILNAKVLVKRFSFPHYVQKKEDSIKGIKIRLCCPMYKGLILMGEISLDLHGQFFKKHFLI